MKTPEKIKTRFFRALLMPVASVYLRIVYNQHSRRYRIPRGENCLILSNHVTVLDPAVVHVCFNREICFLANEEVYYNPALRLLCSVMPVITIHKEQTDPTAIRKCIKWVKGGGTLAIFPEGTRTDTGDFGDIGEAIIKLIRVLGVPVIYFNITGGYGTNPRFGKGVRKGRVDAGVVGKRTVEELKSMTNEELAADIKNMLTVSDVPAKQPFRSARSAEKLERILYRCPLCEGVGKLSSEGRILKCECGMSAEYNDDLTLSSNDRRFPYRLVRDWYAAQKEWVEKFMPRAGQIIHRDDFAVLDILPERGKFKRVDSGLITLTDAALIVGDTVFPLGELRNLVPIMVQSIRFYWRGESYRISGPEGFNNIKYIHMFKRLKKLECAEAV